MIIKKLGPIKELEIYLNKETILLGKNNTGKIYVSYLLYGVFKKLESIKLDIFSNYISKKTFNNKSEFFISIEKKELINFFKKEALKILNSVIQGELPKIFNLKHEDFKETFIKIEDKDLDFLIDIAINKKINIKVRRFNLNSGTVGVICVKTLEKSWDFKLENISNSLFPSEEASLKKEEIRLFFNNIVFYYLSEDIFSIPNILYIPTERSGINVFKNELNIKRSSATFDLKKESINFYPLPILDYMRYLNHLDCFNRDKSIQYLNQDDARKNISKDFSENLLRGNYEFESENNEYYFREFSTIIKDGKESVGNKKIPLKLASASTKSLFGLDYYLRYKCQIGDILFIDEPEMNLDPENQVRLAKLLIRLTEIGVKIIISTHSDYLIRATSNILLESKIESMNSSSNINCLDNYVYGYIFDKDNINFIENLTKENYINNFDDINILLEDKYLEIINKEI